MDCVSQHSDARICRPFSNIRFDSEYRHDQGIADILQFDEPFRQNVFLPVYRFLSKLFRLLTA